MKTLTSLLYVFTLSAMPVLAQDVDVVVYPIDETTKMITYSEVVDMPDLSANELYERAFRWANEYYVNPKDVLRETEVLQGRILCKARFMISNPPDKSGLSTGAGKAMYTLLLEFKENKFRYKIDDIIWIKASKYPIEQWLDKENQYYSDAFAYYLEQCDEHCKTVIAALKEGMDKSVEEATDDW